MQIWEASDEYKQLVKDIKDIHHPHLAQASIWVLISDTKAIVDNKLVATDTRRTTNTEKLKTGHDFKIMIRGSAWNILTDAQRRIAIDEALCRCGVKYVPETIEVNGKKEIITDEIGRIVYTNEIALDGQGNPKWKINNLDAGAYFAMLQRHGLYNEGIENIQLVLAGQPPKGPTAATQDQVGGDDVEADNDVEADIDDVETNEPEIEQPPEEA